MVDKDSIKKALQIESWKSLFENGSSKKSDVSSSSSTKKDVSELSLSSQSKTLSELTSRARILAYDVVTYLDSQFTERQDRLNLSARDLENTKRELLNKGQVKEVWIGKSLFLAPTTELYHLLGVDCPYRRNIWDVHSFLVLLAAKLVGSNPLIKHVDCEVPVSDSGSTIDLVAYLKDGRRWAYEVVHRSITNVAANAAKLQGKGFSQVIFLAVDFNTKEATWASIRNTGFAPDFAATIRCVIFSTLIRQKKQLRLREIQ
jgi:hypothetical protein